MKDLILHTIRGFLDIRDIDKAASFSESSWRELFCLASDVKIAPYVAKKLLPLMPDRYKKIAQQVVYKNKSHVRSQIAALNQLNIKATEEGLRFVLFKGLAHGLLGYERIEDRQTGDIDILVDSSDLARCDYVLKAVGFRQPVDTQAPFSSDIGLGRAKQIIRGRNYAYPIKRKTHGVQLAPYFSDSLNVRAEAHDGFHNIPKSKVPQLLWMTRQVKIGPVKVRTLDERGTFLTLVANAYENSESMYASFDNELNLRDYVDLDMFFQSMAANLDVENLIEAAQDFGLSEALSIVLSNYHDVFPGKSTPLGPCLALPSVTTRGVSFIERAFNRADEKNCVFGNIRSGIRSPEAEAVADCARIGTWTRFENEPQLPIDYRVNLDARGFVIDWKLPKQLDFELPFLGFQIAFIPKKSKNYLELIVGVAFIDGRLVAFCNKSHRLAQRFIAAHSNGIAESSYEETEDSIYISVTAPYSLFSLEAEDFEAGIGIIPMVFLKSASEDYRSINPWERDFTTVKSLAADGQEGAE